MDHFGYLRECNDTVSCLKTYFGYAIGSGIISVFSILYVKISSI